MDWLEIDGHSLRYEMRGTGPGVVLIHELGGMLESFDAVIGDLATDHSVLRYDQRGSGLSEKVRGTLTLDELVGELACLVDELAFPEPFDLIGLALGGSIATRFTALYPQRVRLLVLTAPAVRLGEAAHDRLLARADEVEAGGVREHVDGALPSSYPEVLRGDRARFNRLRAQRLAADPFSLAASLRLLATVDITGDLPCVGTPTLLLAGELDLGRPPAEVQAAANAMPNARMVRVDSGHFIPQHAPEAFIQHLRAFQTETG